MAKKKNYEPIYTAIKWFSTCVMVWHIVYMYYTDTYAVTAKGLED